MAKTILVIAKDFSEFPAGRIPDDGPNSGQRFRDELLAPAIKDALKNDGTVDIDMDNTMGYGSSFLDEAFGGLIREHGLRRDDILKSINLIDNRIIYKKLALRYIDEEHSRTSK